jgi:cysteine-rich repeat protein
MKWVTFSSVISIPFLLMGCQNPICGDLVVDAALDEQCDDGNAADGDGCAADCTLQTVLQSNDINGQNVNDAFFAIFTDIIFTNQDEDQDGVNDDAEAFLAVLISNDPDLCTKVEVNQDIETLPNLKLAILTAQQNQIDSAGVALQTGDTIQGDGANNLVTSFLLVNNVEGATVFFAEDFEFDSDESSGSGIFTIQDLDVDTLSASFVTGLDAFVVDNNGNGVFDDLNGDGETLETTNTAFIANIQNAKRCDVLIDIF